MNLALLFATCFAVKRHRSAGAAALLSMSLFSVEMQLLTLLAAASPYWIASGVNATLLACFVSTASTRRHVRSAFREMARHGRDTFEELKRSPPAALAIVIAGAAFLLIRAVAYLPDSADPYHLVRVMLIDQTGSLAYTPAADAKINSMGFLYELILADIALIPLIGPVVFALYGLWAAAIYSAVVCTVLRRYGLGLSTGWWVATLCIPTVFHQFVLIKNDLLVALFGIPCLVLLHEHKTTACPRGAFRIGALAGLACSVKLAAFPLVIVTILCLSYGSMRRAIVDRTVAFVGGCVGAVVGGLPFTLWNNLAWYGQAITPMTGAGNTPDHVGHALMTAARFGGSLFDASIAMRLLWPNRGGWGGPLGPVVLWAIGVLLINARHNRDARRALVITLVGLSSFGLVYSDADLAHRMIIAFGVFAVLQALIITLQSGRGDRPHTYRQPGKMLLIAACLVACLLMVRSAVRYLAQIEYLRHPSVARWTALYVGVALHERPYWVMRQLNEQIRGADRVCAIGQEHAALLKGVAYKPLVETLARADGRLDAVWRTTPVTDCEVVVIYPNDYPNNAVADALVQQCTGRSIDLSAADPTVGAYFCAR